MRILGIILCLAHHLIEPSSTDDVRSWMTDQPIADAPEAARNPLGTAGLVVAVVGYALFLGMIGGIEWMAWDERTSGAPPVARPAPPVAEALFFVAGCFCGGLASLVGLVLSVVGLRRQPRTLALWGLVVCLLSLALVVGWYVVRHADVGLS